MLPTPHLLRPNTNLVRKRCLFRHFAVEVFVIGLRIGAGSFDMDQSSPVATNLTIFRTSPKRGHQFLGTLEHVVVFNRRRLWPSESSGRQQGRRRHRSAEKPALKLNHLPENQLSAPAAPALLKGKRWNTS